MYCTIKQKKGKKGVISYSIYLSERKRIQGKVKSSDIYIMTLHEEDIRKQGYIPKVEYLSISQEERQMILDKISKLDIPLQDTTYDKPLQTTTRVEFEIKVIDGSRYVGYKCYIADRLIREFDEIDFMYCRVNILMKVLEENIAEKGITDKELIIELKDKVLNIWEYYDDMKGRREAEKQANDNYYEEIIRNLQIELAYARGNNARSSFDNVTTDKEKLRTVYKKLSIKLHPDNPGGSVEAMQMLNELKENLDL